MSLLNGDGTARDPKESVAWFERAALQGQVNAQFTLAVMYLRGTGVDRDAVRGFAWLDIAATRGFEPAVRARETVLEQIPAGTLAQARKLAHELATELAP